MDDASLQIELGSVSSYYGELIFTLVIKEDGSERLYILGLDPSDKRKAGIFLFLSPEEVEKLSNIIEKAKTAGTRFKAAQISNQTVQVISVKNEEDDARKLYQSAKDCLSSGDRVATIAILRNLVERYPGSAWATKAQKALADAKV